MTHDRSLNRHFIVPQHMHPGSLTHVMSMMAPMSSRVVPFLASVSYTDTSALVAAKILDIGWMMI